MTSFMDVPLAELQLSVQVRLIRHRKWPPNLHVTIDSRAYTTDKLATFL